MQSYKVTNQQNPFPKSLSQIKLTNTTGTYIFDSKIHGQLLAFERSWVQSTLREDSINTEVLCGFCMFLERCSRTCFWSGVPGHRRKTRHDRLHIRPAPFSPSRCVAPCLWQRVSGALWSTIFVNVQVPCFNRLVILNWGFVLYRLVLCCIPWSSWLK